MRYSKLLIIILIANFSLNCSQKKENIKDMDVNSKNIVEEIAKHVKHYDYEPRYFIEIGQNMCNAEIFVNGLPVYRNFEELSVSTSISINHCVFNSGLQKITYKIYSNDNKNAFLEINVKEFDNKNPESDGKEIFNHKSNMLTTNVDYSSTPYEQTFDFKAVVPYELIQIGEYEDLRQIDEGILQSKLENKYNNIKKLYEDKDINGFAKIMYPSMCNQFVSEYNDKTIQFGWNELSEVFENPTLKIQKVDSYHKEVSQNGRFVRFIQNSNDIRLKKKSVIWGLYKVQNKTKAMFNGSSFYLPKDKTEFEVY